VPRPGPVPTSAPAVSASGPPKRSRESKNPLARGARRKPSATTDCATMKFSAITRPWKRCGTLTCTIVNQIPFWITMANQAANAPTVIRRRSGRRPMTAAPAANPAVAHSMPRIR
jgi:hypothetical protein